MNKDVIRRCHFAPYPKGKVPTFNLTLWDTHRPDWRGCSMLGYRLTMRSSGHGRGTTLFEGEDFSSSPLHAIDSDSTVKAIMAFLCLRPGDTDAEYFERYTETQLHYCMDHAEYLWWEVIRRFGEDR